ncbi:hypothetical protein K8Z61_06530 [Nocardioides sp. TRM66260-LWL]|uniref:hypothetical protein n=1 Tax=Nocardioides sp. TRM66260-LWL TaxID=2874478 RepID=UPI001CC78D6C|nr:hypothetical protein [Nocardioides sp. TRM66260-LWL]MBZ5734148.1 hypothetical protein [Nocardioides sp. TRM66260-LWL]
MNTDPITQRLDQLIETLDDPRAAYVVRSRLDRVLLLVNRTIGGADLDDQRASKVEQLTRDIDEHFAALRRRSEPFGEAWLTNLASARKALLDLRQVLA